MFARLAVLVSIGVSAVIAMLPSIAPPAQVIAVLESRSVNPGTSIAADQCFTFGFDAASAAECGDLRVAHTLPATRTRGAARAPTLVYHAQQAHPYPVVRANLTSAFGTLRYGNATLYLIVNGTPVPVAAQSYSDLDMFPGSSRRLALTFDGITYPTGVYPYIVTFSGVGRSSFPPFADVPVFAQTADTLLIVNRSTSEFGAGWWPAGYEQLLSNPDSSKLWVGGDGSARLYRSHAGQWVADTLTRPDSIISPTGTSTFVRAAEDGARVVFNNSGEHIATINRLDDTTTFARTGGRLTGITLPRGGLTYTFAYDGNQKLMQVTPPAVSGTPRTVGASVNSGRLVSITDPDGFATTFAYSSTVANLMVSRSDKHTRTRAFTFDGAMRLAGTTVYAGAGSTDPITWTMCAAETRGLLGGGPCGASVLPYTDARTTIDGPRAVADTWNIAVNRHGAVDSFRDPRGSVSTFQRTDTRFPGLVTQATDPNGFVQQYTYTERGNVQTRTDVDALGPAMSSVYSYVYGSTQWPDGVTTMFLPMDGWMQFTYDTRGNVLTREDSRGAAGRTTLNYGTVGTSASGLLVSVVQPNTVAGRTDFDSLQYDAMGNVSDVRTASRVGGTTTIHSATHTSNDAIGRVAQTCVDLSIGGTPPQQCTATTFSRMDRDSVVTVTAPLGVGTQTLTTRSRYDREGRLTWLQRQSSLPDAGIGAITTQWQYDSAGRRIVETAPDSRTDRTFYDAAGNVERVITRKSDTVSMTYGLANELLTRRLSAVQYPAVTDTAYDALAFPWKPNSGSDYLIPVDTQRFTYDSAGRILTANNRDARVTRTYLRSGLLATERQNLRASNAAAVDTTKHNYLLSFRYDLRGRRTVVKLPAQLATAGQDSLLRIYHPYRDELLAVADPLGNTFTYNYTVRGEPETLDFPGGYQEQWTYSAAGYDSLNVITNISTASGRLPYAPARNARSGFDARGFRQFLFDGSGLRDTSRFTYTGMGHLDSSSTSQMALRQGGSARARSSEKLTYDGLGNILTSRTQASSNLNESGTLYTGTSAATQNFNQVATYQAGVGRLQEQLDNPRGTRSFVYDSAGNTTWSRFQGDPTASAQLREARRSYYAADGTLRAADYRWRSSLPTHSIWRRVFETYRYDALGRRVAVRADRECDLTDYAVRERLACDLSTYRRIVWEDEQQIGEFQTLVKLPGLSPAADAVVDNDGVQDSLPRVLSATQDPNPFFGRVVYTAGLTLDQPLALTRYGYTDYATATTSYVKFPPVTVSLMWTALGKVGLAACVDGKAQCTATNGVGRTASMVLSVPDLWFMYERPKYVPVSWHGNVLDDQQTGTGTHYRRNRYYDPGAGRFTQEDPIGLAGGLNLYGFAGSNPANFSDPFGLCPFFLTGKPCSAGLAIGFGFVPIAGDAYDIISAFVGKDLLTGESIGIGGAAATLVGTIAGSGKLAREVTGVASTYSSITRRSARVWNRATNVDAVRFGENLIESGFERSGHVDGIVKYTKGNQRYIVRGPERSNSGWTADVYFGDDLQGKIRLGRP
ncbi:MAG TPA: RHS repeat-associated core domain-containing protein [Gemmatimonas sp.]|uniref:RHS repeat-associated core domain-containing protein n=1 Tax=Gemmatimonas sp. TaxID=1962908 RepID=UPI002ED953F8